MIIRKLKIDDNNIKNIIKHQNKIKEIKEDGENLDKIFNCIKLATIKNEKIYLKYLLETLFLEEIDEKFLFKIYYINKDDIDYFCNIWKKRYIQFGEQGFLTTIYPTL